VELAKYGKRSCNLTAMARTYLEKDNFRRQLFELKVVGTLFSTLKHDEGIVRKSGLDAIVKLASYGKLRFWPDKHHTDSHDSETADWRCRLLDFDIQVVAILLFVLTKHRQFGLDVIHQISEFGKSHYLI
jgi:hypothetical protein